jgi:hypothetical protein
VITIARLTLDRAASGLPPTLRDLDAVPACQWEIYFTELSPLCPSSLKPIPVKQRNALRVEMLPSREPRCSRRSPDGRGLAWLLSGGEPLAYGLCLLSRCPRATPSPSAPTRNDSKENT